MKLIKFILSLVLIISTTILSQWFVKATNIKFPGPLLGMLILTGLMYFKIIDIKFVELAGNILLKNISLFFVPLLVGGFSYLFTMEDNFWIIFSIFIITSVMLIIFTGITLQYLLMKKIYRKKTLRIKRN